MPIKNLLKNRVYILIVITAVLALVLAVRLIDIQLVQGEYYRQVSDSRMYSTMVDKAPRGEISDRYGRAIASNKAAHSIMINYSTKTVQELNETVANLIITTEENGYVYEDSLPISYSTPYTFRFDEMHDGSEEEKWKEKMEFSASDTAETVMQTMIAEYELENITDPVLQRKAAGLRYDMQLRNFGRRNPFLYMSDIDMEFVSKIKENPKNMVGVEVISEPVRDYPMEGIAAHLLGQVGIIYRDEYEELEDEGYGLNDTLGKDGLEKYLERYLRGENGQESAEYNINGEVVSLAEKKEATPGNRAILTIDANMQQVAEQALKEAVANMRAGGATQAAGAAAVAIEVNSGEVLALANYPTYNPAEFKTNYSELLNDPLTPMFNRAVSGAYPPGSTFKPLTAIASLEEGIVTGGDLIDCNGPYMYYAPSYTPACWIYNDYRGKHGPINVVTALEVSCNIYFFDVARKLGIEKLNEYGKKFGLGELTGIEIAGEVSGMLAGPKSREAAGGVWYPGDTIQAAIGQSDNSFTPLQMANYAATIANGGTRYAPHVVKDIVSYDGTQTVVSFAPKVLSQIEIQPENLQLVHQGMKQVVETTSKTSFEGAGYQAAGKTGTAQTRLDKTPHSWFISFAPYENPQVAIAVVVEHGGVNGMGGHVSKVARKMYDSYFYSDEDETFNIKNTLY